MQEQYLTSARKQFAYYKQVGEKTFAQLEDPALFWQYSPQTNSIAVLVNHLWGNMMSRWTDFLETDGEKDWRERDQEFELVIQTREEMIAKWEEGWACLFNALDSIAKEHFAKPVYVRNEAHTIVEAINRQLAHYAYHIGQIVYIGIMLKGEAWQSLTIPKGDSQAFNAEKFAQPKGKHHFGDSD